MTRRWDRPDLDPITFVRHWEDAAAVIRVLPALPPAGVSARELLGELLEARQVRARPTADHPAFSMQPGARTEALVAAYQGIRGTYFRPEERRSLTEASHTIRAWIATEL